MGAQLFRAITGTITLRTPLHVGTGRSTESADDLLRRDVRGRLLIPGSAIAGTLRSLATRLAPRLQGVAPCKALVAGDRHRDDEQTACGCLVCRLFGDITPQEDSSAGTAASVIVYDALLEGDTKLQIRDGVGIDRAARAAARRTRTKYDFEVLPANAQFTLRIELDARQQELQALQLLAAALAEWQAGRGALGGSAARGLGAFDLKDVQFHTRDLNKTDTLLDFLRNGPPWQAEDGDREWLATQVESLRPSVQPCSKDTPAQTAGSWVLLTFTLAADGPFLTNDLVQAGRSGFDHAPLLTDYDSDPMQDSRPVLAGSSLRGVLRSQAERIARSITTLRAAEETGAAAQQAYFNRHCPACHPLVDKAHWPNASCSTLLKGFTKEQREEFAKNGAEEEVCLACRLFGSTWNGSRLRVEDAPLRENTTPVYKPLDFLAIDRFTGGGRDSAKFDAVVLWQPQFSVRMFLENPQAWELGWLALVLRDLHEGMATVGFGAAKGFGCCRIANPVLKLGVLHAGDFPSKSEVADKLLASASGSSGVYREVQYAEQQNMEWRALIGEWIRDFTQKVAQFPEGRSQMVRTDSYFAEVGGHSLPSLYPARIVWQMA